MKLSLTEKEKSKRVKELFNSLKGDNLNQPKLSLCREILSICESLDVASIQETGTPARLIFEKTQRIIIEMLKIKPSLKYVNAIKPIVVYFYSLLDRRP